MKSKRILVRKLMIFLLGTLMLLTSCQTDTDNLPSVSDSVHIDETSAEPVTVTSEITFEETTAEDTEPVSSERYTIRHTVHNLSQYLPQKFLESGNIKDAVIHPEKNGCHIYVANHNSKQPTIYTLSSDLTTPVTQTSVPLVDNNSPSAAYRLSDGRFILFGKVGLPHLMLLTEEDGTILAQIQMDYPDYPQDYIVTENETGISVLVYSKDGSYHLYQYDSKTNLLTSVRGFDNAKISSDYTFIMRDMRPLGDNLYLASNFIGTSAIQLDMNDGTLKPKSIRLPKDKTSMTVHIGTDQNIYLSDYEGIYLYNNDIPTKVLDWTECNIRKSDNLLWIIDEHTFYFLKSKIVNGKAENTLQCVTTERIPYEDPRTTIQITSFDIQTEWLTNAIHTFNTENENYRIDLHYVNTIDRSTEDINADLADLMLYGEHPDILLFTPSAWVPLDIYYEKEVFLDLMPLLGDDLLTCAAEGMTWNGKLYTLPTTMELQTFVCADSVTDTALTWEKFHSVIDSVSVPDSILTTDPNVIDYIYNNGIMDFCDVGRAESYYDTDAFRDMLNYHQKLESMIAEDVGIIKRAVDQSYGYTRASLPAYLGEGRIKFLNVPIGKLNDILAPMLIYGDTDFTWCGYPSRDGGSAHLNFARNMFSVFSDSDVTDGCIEFLLYLLSEEQQCQPTLPYLPVTESGLRALIDHSRWWYYEESIYKKFCDPNAELVEAPFYGVLSALKYIPTRAVGSTAVLVEDFGQTPDDIEYDEAWMKPSDVTYVPVELTDDYADTFIDFLNSCHMKANVDNTLKSIITEEISYWENNARSLEETTKIIDSRVWIYLNE